MRSLFSINGRIGRHKYWINTAISFVILLGISGISSAINPDPNAFTAADMWILSPLSIVGFWIAFSARIRRMHDHNKSGFWLLLSLVPIIGEIWLFIELGFLEGDRRHNLFGAPDTT